MTKLHKKVFLRGPFNAMCAVVLLSLIYSETKCFAFHYTSKDYAAFGAQRANFDFHKRQVYAVNNYGLALLGNVQTIRQKSLQTAYFHCNDPKTQNRYLSAFSWGYRHSMRELKGNSVITQTPLIATFIGAIRNYAQAHNNRIPSFHDATGLYIAIHRELPGYDPYAGTRVKYGVNKRFSGATINTNPIDDVIIWEISKKDKPYRYVGHLNGEIEKIRYPNSKVGIFLNKK